MAIWESTTGVSLQQGDLLPDCLIPLFSENYGESAEDVAEVSAVDTIILTQSCDWVVRENGTPKIRLVAVCPIYSLDVISKVNPTFRDPKLRERVRRGEVNGLHMVASPDLPMDNTKSLIAVF